LKSGEANDEQRAPRRGRETVSGENAPTAIGVMLVGGSGTRLWPMSSVERPKQFLRLFGRYSLYQQTLARLRASRLAAVAAIGNAAHQAALREEARDLGGAEPVLLLEPVARDSAAAVAAAAAWALAHYGRDSVIVAVPSDHLIPDEAAFAAAVTDAVALASSGWIVTLGVTPTFACTEYGYIERGAPIGQNARAFAAAKFHEKPNQSTAADYIARGDSFWNSGIFVFSAGLFADEAARLMPAVWAAAVQAVGRGVEDRGALKLDESAFAAAPKLSLDYALMEKSRRVALIPVSFAWSDVGNWQAVYQALDKDQAGNAVRGEAVLADSSGTLVIADGVKAALSGLHDMDVVCSADGVFIAPRVQASAVKRLIGS
jgi:mannose-1-phosphate guanylyltransferase/mannose-6-phosphate isomerase